MSASSCIRKRPVSFGNPALATYQGFVYTVEESSTETIRDINDSSVVVETTDTQKRSDGESTTTSLSPSAQMTERTIAMVGVPPDQVPEGILNLARSYRSLIEHVRILISESDNDDPSSQSSLRGHEGSAISSSLKASMKSSERSYLILFRLMTVDDALMMAMDLDGRPYTSFDETVTCRALPVIATEGEGGVSLFRPLFARSTKTIMGDQERSTDTTTETSSASNPSALTTVTDDHIYCAVCLEHMPFDESGEEKRSYLTTVCNHTFHLDCIVRCQDSPCPVCRYDHSGLNEALSQCSICGATDRNYVCLICGVVSCVGGHGTSTARVQCLPATTTTTTTATGTADPNSSEPERAFFTNHASQHYHETLHAYALDTETQHVWDFAGQGYVHRLLQNKEDGKLVEVSDPNNTTSQERSMTPGLSDTQEGEVVHRKLEGFASQYNTLLKSQLEQQRTYYEGRLEEVRREFALKKKHAAAEKGDFIAALRQEKKQLSNRLLSMNRKTQKVTDDIGFLKNMNESLQANKGPLQQKIRDAQREQIASREMLLQHLPALEEKLAALMLQLTGG